MSFATLEQHEYVNVETFRKNGDGVRTPLWFVIDNGRLYVRTPASTAKVKRLRNNPRARIAVCDRAGNVTGDWSLAAGVRVDGDEAARASALLKRKYGILGKIMFGLGELRKYEYAVLAFTPAEQ